MAAAAGAAAAVRRCAAILSVLAIAAAWFPIVALATSGAASAASAGALSCDGSTIYSYQRGGPGTDPSTTGSVYGLSTGTFDRASATVTASLVTRIPQGGGANGMGITKGGTAIYVVNQVPVRVNDAIIHGYNTSTRTWKSYPRGSSGTRGFVAGAVDPANDTYYYVAYAKGTVTTPATGTVYGFNTHENTPIGGIIATFNLPTGANPNDQNGDIAFDSAGNMYVLSSDKATVAIGVVDGPIPTTGSASGVHLADTVLTSYRDTSTYNGIAFDNAGHLYVSGTSGKVSVLTKLNPTTGAILAGPTPLSSSAGAQKYSNVDLAACSLNPTLSLQKNIVGRYAPGDQFGLKITGGGISGGNIATTTGSETGVQPEPAIAGPVIAQSGTTYTLAETAASGNLLNYTTKYSCVDTANDTHKDLPAGTGQSFTLQFPPTTGISPNIVCTFTNTPVTTTITLQKTVTETALSLGETLHYGFLVTNTGSVTLAPVTVAETAFTGSGTPPVASCPAGASSLAPGASSLAPGASVTCTATYTVTQADIDAGQVKNTATATGISPAGQSITSAPSSATVSAGQYPAITVVKSATPSSFAAAGTTIDYSFLVTNTGNVTLAPVTITETAFTGSGTPPVASCPAGASSLAPRASVTCTATYVTTQADVDAGSVTNTATATGVPPAGPSITSAPSTATVPAVQAPAITVVKSATPSSFAAAGTTIDYGFLVTNTGNVTLSSVEVTDIDLPGLSAITCPDASLAPAGSQTCTATYVTIQADVDAGSVTNTATAQGDPPGPATPVVSDPSTATVPAVQAPAITVVKSATPSSFAAAGTTIDYSFLVTNTGNVTLWSVQVTDTDLPGLSAITCPDASLAPATAETCTATYVTTQADVDAGSVANTATALGNPPGSITPVGSAPSTTTVPAVQAPAITVVKSALPGSFSTGGTTLTYSFLVTNTGNVTLSSIQVTDTDLPGLSAITCPDASLAPATAETCTATYVTTQADVDAGSVTNTATVQGDPPGSTTPLTSPPSTAIVLLRQTPTPPPPIVPPKLPVTG